MTFVNNNGKVPYIMVAGADHVSGEMPLEASMTAYEEGVKLYAQLCERLEESEKKLKILSGAQEEA